MRVYNKHKGNTMDNSYDYNPALDELEGLVTMLNDLVRNTGDIPRDHSPLWNNYLHKWTHFDMLHILAVMNAVRQANPNLFSLDQETHLDKIMDTVFRGIELNKRNTLLGRKQTRNVLDLPPKGDYWKFVMHIREIWNKVHNAPLPIYAKKKKKKVR